MITQISPIHKHRQRSEPQPSFDYPDWAGFSTWFGNSACRDVEGNYCPFYKSNLLMSFAVLSLTAHS